MRSDFTRKTASVRSMTAALAVLAVLIGGAITIRLLPQKSGTAVISVDGQVVKRLPLERDFTFSPDGCEIEFAVQDGEIRVTETSCKDKICMRTGAISRRLQCIVCLPQRVVVTIEDNTESNIDVVI